jgi:threonyl-tRNA synthetase
MKILTLHCDYIKFKPLKKAIKNSEEVKDMNGKEVKEPLVVLIAVENGDNDKVVSQLIDAVKKTSAEVRAKSIVLYPYAHLSSNLANPDTALEYLVEAEKTLSKEGYKVVRAPFGYYKEFELKVKGHPLSELSKEFHPESLALTPKEVVAKSQELKEEKYEPVRLLREISKSKLDTSKLKDNDHRILGQKLDLFSFSETAPGMVFWHNNGWIIVNELINFWRDEHRKDGYQEISTPQVLDKKLWQISGHWEKYRENIFLSKYEGRDFAVKPMNCPGGMLVYKSRQRSYRELPMRVAELGIVHRQELSGVLAGLFRVIKFTQDDAHIFCTEEQLEGEIKKIISLIGRIYKKFGFEYAIELSTRPEKRIGGEKLWDKAEAILDSVLKKEKIKYKLNKGEGAFYGPKIDFHIKDSLGRTWQCATIQLDFAMPERFELEYIDKDNKAVRPIMLHRAVFGSLERFVGILLEHLNGSLPLWLSPIQARIINFTDRNTKSCEKLLKELRDEIPSLRIDSDFRATTINEKIRDAEIQKIPCILVIGDKEEESKTIAVRQRGAKPKFKVKAKDLIAEIKEKIEKRA